MWKFLSVTVLLQNFCAQLTAVLLDFLQKVSERVVFCMIIHAKSVVPYTWLLSSENGLYFPEQLQRRRRKIALHWSICTYWQERNEEGWYYLALLLLRKRIIVMDNFLWIWKHMFSGLSWWQLICFSLPLSCWFFLVALLNIAFKINFDIYQTKSLLAYLPFLKLCMLQFTFVLKIYPRPDYLAMPPCSGGLTFLHNANSLVLIRPIKRTYREAKSWSVPWFLSMTF